MVYKVIYMLNKKFYKNNLNYDDYAKCAEWCNNNGATIIDKGEYFECVQLEKPTVDELIKTLTCVVQDYMDTTVQKRGYDNIFACVSYVNSSDETFKYEANAALIWRDNVWKQFHTLIKQYQNGEKPISDDVEELTSILPKLEW